MQPPAPILATERLALRELVPADLDFVAGMLGHPEVMRYYPKVHTRAEAEGWLNRQRERYARDGHGLWLVSERQSGEPVGQVGLLTQLVDDAREPEVGYLLHRPYWHRGYATEAAAVVRDYAFAVRGHPYVISLIRPENAPSQAVARRLGMAPTRTTTFAGYTTLVFRVDRPRS